MRLEPLGCSWRSKKIYDMYWSLKYPGDSSLPDAELAVFCFARE
jgi:hypothetical protein